VFSRLCARVIAPLIVTARPTGAARVIAPGLRYVRATGVGSSPDLVDDLALPPLAFPLFLLEPLANRFDALTEDRLEGRTICELIEPVN
jgi:hypothetical protein